MKENTINSEYSLLKDILFNNKIDSSEEKQEVKSVIKMPMLAGGAVTFIVLCVFVIWSGLAPLDSAAIAPGSVVLDSKRKTIQHLEGGIITDILVKEGEYVVTGQPLVHLNNTSAKARKDILAGQLYLAKVTEARLEYERDSIADLKFPENLLAQNKTLESQKIIDSQTRLFKTRRESIINQIDILQQRIYQFSEQIDGFTSQKGATAEQLALIKKELKTVESLLKDGLATQTRKMELQRNKAELQGRMGELSAEIARVNESITEAQMQMINAQSEYQKDVMTQLKEAQQQIADLQEEIFASDDILERTVINSPISGKITGLQYHTIGGVITPGTPIMDIVPDNDKLIVEARVSPQDIDIVHQGLEAKVMLSAYKSRFVPRVQGNVLQVSADSFTDEKTGESYYLARVEISKNALEKLATKVELYPGMPAEVFITTGERTMLQYLASPITDSFRRSFKEE